MARLTRPTRELAKRVLGIGAMSVGRIGSTKPLSSKWGLDRGKPIDRYYIDKFVTQHASDVKGRVLEVKHDDYASRTGGKSVKRLDIVSLEADNPSATIIGDIVCPGTLPHASFDCVILTQTLHLIFDMAVALENIRKALRPGGVALITVPGITPILPDASFPWYWSLTQQSLRKLLVQQFDENQVELVTYGNLFSATAFLHAAAVEEVPRRKLDKVDPAYPVTAACVLEAKVHLLGCANDESYRMISPTWERSRPPASAT